MRRPHILVISLLLILPAIGFCQQNGIEDALKKGDAKALGIYFSHSVDLSIPGSETTMTADQAVTALTTFFQKQAVKDYKKVHASASQQGRSDFTIGELYTSQGTYRMTLFFNKEQKIAEVEIRK